jgi:hypothetical protein
MKQVYLDDEDGKKSIKSEISHWSIVIAAILVFIIILTLILPLLFKSIGNLTDDSEVYEIVSENLGVDEDKMIITKEENHIYKVETDDFIYKVKVSLDKNKVTNTVIVETK